MISHSWKFSRYRQVWLFGIYMLFILLGAVTAQGATYYVATTGNDSNPGTLNQPFKSFKKGVQLLQPGDTLYIRGGVYSEQIDLQGPNKTGTTNAWLRIGGYPGESVTLQYADLLEHSYGPIKARGNRGYLIFENLILDGSLGTNLSGWSIRDGNHHFTLRNLEIKNFRHVGLYISSATDVQIVNCTIHDQISVSGQPGQRWYGIYFHDGTNSVIEGNKIYNNPGGGIQAYPGPISNLVIRNNDIHHNNYLSTSPVPGILVSRGAEAPISGVHIYNNLVHLNGVNQPDPDKSGGITISNVTRGTRIWNNTVYGNNGWGINIQNGSGGPPEDTVVQNNIVFANKSGQIIDKGKNSTISHNLSTDPRFINAEASDFRLQMRSSAIDSGILLNEVRSDINNASRPQGATHDLGAYEGGFSETPLVSIPKDLSIK